LWTQNGPVLYGLRTCLAVVLFGSGNEIPRAHAECCGDALHCPPARRRLARLGSRKRPGCDPGAVCEIFLCQAAIESQAFDRAAEVGR